MCLPMCMWVLCLGWLEEGLSPLELELQLVVTHPK